MAANRQGVTANREGGTRVLPFALPLTVIPTENATLPKCLWCKSEFAPVRKNQAFCKRGHSRDACERRKAEGIKTLTEYFMPFGKPFGLTQKHIEDCTDLFWTRCRAVLETLSYQYDEHEKQWIKAL